MNECRREQGRGGRGRRERGIGIIKKPSVFRSDISARTVIMPPPIFRAPVAIRLPTQATSVFKRSAHGITLDLSSGSWRRHACG